MPPTDGPDQNPLARPRRVLFVFWWLVVGGEETEVRLLAKHLDPKRYCLEVVACVRKPGMSEQTHAQLAALDVVVDRAPYVLSLANTVSYLAGRLPAFDIIVACQGVPVGRQVDMQPDSLLRSESHRLGTVIEFSPGRFSKPCQTTIATTHHGFYRLSDAPDSDAPGWSRRCQTAPIAAVALATANAVNPQ
jgi:hypothetical protein